MSDSRKNEFPNNQEEYYIEKERELNEKKKIYDEVISAVEKQRRDYLEREIKLRQMVAEIITHDVEKRLQSDETKKLIEMRAMEQIAIKKKRAQDNAAIDKFDNFLKRIDNDGEEIVDNSDEKRFPKTEISAVIREEVQKALKKQGHSGDDKSTSEKKKQTRGGKFKFERDEYYRYTGRGARGQQYSRRGILAPRYGYFDYPPLGEPYYYKK